MNAKAPYPCGRTLVGPTDICGRLTAWQLFPN